MRNTVLLPLLLLFACNGAESTDEGPAPAEEPATASAPAREPDYVTVDHILIGIQMPKLPHVTRGAAEAKTLAYDLLKKLKAGADWDALKRQYTDDRQNGVPGGPYSMANHGVRPRTMNDIPRQGMVGAFGDVGFKLKVGEIAVADHGPSSPYGYHIIKRVK